MDVDNTAQKGWEWNVRELKSWEKGCSGVLLWVAGVRRPQKGASDEGAVWEGIYEGYSEVVSEVDSGLGGEGFWQQRSGILRLVVSGPFCAMRCIDDPRHTKLDREGLES